MFFLSKFLKFYNCSFVCIFLNFWFLDLFGENFSFRRSVWTQPNMNENSQQLNSYNRLSLVLSFRTHTNTHTAPPKWKQWNENIRFSSESVSLFFLGLEAFAENTKMTPPTKPFGPLVHTSRLRRDHNKNTKHMFLEGKTVTIPRFSYATIKIVVPLFSAQNLSDN